MYRITQEHLDFLNQLALNNNRTWFNEHKKDFDRIYAEVKVFFTCVYDKIQETDHIEQFHMHRIYRNLQFSKDKTPYKTHFALHLGRQKPLLRGGYYLHIQPNESFVVGGFWHPNSDDLQRVRREIAANPQPLKNILDHKLVVNLFGTL